VPAIPSRILHPCPIQKAKQELEQQKQRDSKAAKDTAKAAKLKKDDETKGKPAAGAIIGSDFKKARQKQEKRGSAKKQRAKRKNAKEQHDIAKEQHELDNPSKKEAQQRVPVPEPAPQAARDGHGAAPFRSFYETKKSLRYGVGDRVTCNKGGQWSMGTVVRLMYRHNRMPPNMFHPYQIKLDDGELIYAPADRDAVIQKVGVPTVIPEGPPSTKEGGTLKEHAERIAREIEEDQSLGLDRFKDTAHKTIPPQGVSAQGGEQDIRTEDQIKSTKDALKLLQSKNQRLEGEQISLLDRLNAGWGAKYNPVLKQQGITSIRDAAGMTYKDLMECVGPVLQKAGASPLEAHSIVDAIAVANGAEPAYQNPPPCSDGSNEGENPDADLQAALALSLAPIGASASVAHAPSQGPGGGSGVNVQTQEEQDIAAAIQASLGNAVPAARSGSSGSDGNSIEGQPTQYKSSSNNSTSSTDGGSSSSNGEKKQRRRREDSSLPAMFLTKKQEAAEAKKHDKLQRQIGFLSALMNPTDKDEKDLTAKKEQLEKINARRKQRKARHLLPGVPGTSAESGTGMTPLLRESDDQDADILRGSTHQKQKTPESDDQDADILGGSTQKQKTPGDQNPSYTDLPTPSQKAALSLLDADSIVGDAHTFLQGGMPVSTYDLVANIRANPRSGVIALYDVSQHGKAEVAKVLLDAGADKDAIMPNGCTSLTIASQKGHAGVAKVLLDAGADKEATTFNGLTSLYLASCNGHLEVVKLLLDAGVDTKATCPGGYTSLHIASHKGHLEVVKLLLDAGADVGATTPGGRTAIYVASQEGHAEVVKMLLDATCPGATVDDLRRMLQPDENLATPPPVVKKAPSLLGTTTHSTVKSRPGGGAVLATSGPSLAKTAPLPSKVGTISGEASQKSTTANVSEASASESPGTVLTILTEIVLTVLIFLIEVVLIVLLFCTVFPSPLH
jgi:hypothetical protein